MAEVIFLYDNIPTTIQCGSDENMIDIFKKFCVKSYLEMNNIYFIYNGKTINSELKLNEVISESDKRLGKLKILVNTINDVNKEINDNLITSNDIICPICKEICFFKFQDYKINLYDCKNEHKQNILLFNDFNKTQKVDQTKIICDNCKKTNKGETYKKEFWKCLTCEENLCPICKSSHDEMHEILNYEERNYMCKIHNEIYFSYCTKCKINLCMSCESEHEDKNNIIFFKDIMPKKEVIKSITDEIKLKVENFKQKISNLIQMLKKVNENIDIYYNINNSIIKSFERKKRNYQILKNVNNIINNNKMILNDIDKIIKEKELNNIFNSSFELYNKMTNLDFKESKKTEITKNNNQSAKNEIKNENKGENNQKVKINEKNAQITPKYEKEKENINYNSKLKYKNITETPNNDKIHYITTIKDSYISIKSNDRIYSYKVVILGNMGYELFDALKKYNNEKRIKLDYNVNIFMPTQQEKYDSIPNSYYRDSFLCLYAISSSELNNIKILKNRISKFYENSKLDSKLILIQNNTSLKKNKMITNLVKIDEYIVINSSYENILNNIFLKINTFIENRNDKHVSSNIQLKNLKTKKNFCYFNN